MPANSVVNEISSACPNDAGSFVRLLTGGTGSLAYYHLTQLTVYDIMHTLPGCHEKKSNINYKKAMTYQKNQIQDTHNVQCEASPTFSRLTFALDARNVKYFKIQNST